MTKKIVWSNADLDYEDWRQEMEEKYPYMTECQRIEKMYEENASYLEDERMNLNIQLDGPIIVIGTLGLWDGRKNAYKFIKSGNIRDCLYATGDEVTWYVDGYKNFRCTIRHHDGTNHYLYREMKPISDGVMGRFLQRILEGKVTPTMLTQYTKSVGRRVAGVYGF